MATTLRAGLRPAGPDLRAAVADAPRGTRLLEPLLELGCSAPRDLAALGRALLDDARWSERLDALALAAERAPADAFDNALWPRDVHASILDRLTEEGAALVG
ncbi:MAG: hypothetical protein HYV15_08155, partial [Elusimicrobia bacterium]|nr:hypothetical protein [Elusimicrobiota bacterium]